MTIDEIKGAIKFGKEVVVMYKVRNEEVPDFVHDRIIELQEMLFRMLGRVI